MNGKPRTLAELLCDTTVSEEERSLARQVQTQLQNLGIFTNNFRDAVSLFGHLRSLPRDQTRGGWIFIPARDGAITLHNIAKCIESIKALTHSCAGLSNSDRNKELKKASKNLTADFPGIEKLRHGVAHAGEIKKTSQKQELHSTNERFEGGGISVGRNSFVSDTLTGDTYRTTF